MAGDSSSDAGCALDQLFLRQFEKQDRLLTAYNFKVLKKAVERVAGFYVVEQSLDGHSRPRETGRAVHDSRVHRDHAGKARFLRGSHTLKLTRQAPFLWNLMGLYFR